MAKVRVGVADQERAKEFWTAKLGARVVQDESYGAERWLEVALPDGVVLILEARDGDPEPTSPGQPNTPLFLACEDVDATFAELSAKGVEFVQEPMDMPFGRWALFTDGGGNRYPLVQKG